MKVAFRGWAAVAASIVGLSLAAVVLSGQQVDPGQVLQQLKRSERHVSSSGKELRRWLGSGGDFDVTRREWVFAQAGEL